MRDGPLRRSLKAIALLSFRLGLTLSRSRRSGAGWTLGGACRRSGLCCEAPSVQVGPATWFVPSVRRAFLWWQRRVNGFELTGQDPRYRALAFRCTHYDRATRSCDSYDSRPGICRDYPRHLLNQPAPEFLPGCGYRALPGNAGRLRRALEGQPLSPEQRARLARDLGIDPDA
jgi:uncharacterized protein